MICIIIPLTVYMHIYVTMVFSCTHVYNEFFSSGKVHAVHIYREIYCLKHVIIKCQRSTFVQNK